MATAKRVDGVFDAESQRVPRFAPRGASRLKL